MKKTYFIIIAILILFACGRVQKQKEESLLNLDFEKVENGFPDGWESNISKNLTISLDSAKSGISLDSTEVKSGKYSVLIDADSSFVDGILITYKLPENYDGERFSLSGYIKTENVTGKVGLIWMSSPYVLEMLDTITGTTEWKRYEVTGILYPSLTKTTSIGGYLAGKGKVWFDDFKITIDGKDIQYSKPYEPKPFPADLDKSFDKSSNIIFPELNEQKINDLELLGRIWGFLKYHHLAIAKGNYNWDYELFRMLPDYLQVNDNQQRDKVLVKWINKYGRVAKCKICQATPDSAFLKPDLGWIDKSDMNRKLKNKLQYIYSNRTQGRHYYIAMRPDVGNPIFTNERTYEAITNPDAGFRLLALYRYWNMINYFSPYKYLTDKDWNTVLKEYIPYFVKEQNREEYELNATMLIGEVCDSHAYLMKKREINEKGQVPALVRFVENKLAVMEYYDGRDELKKGDIITRIEGKPVEALVDSMRKYFPASNESARMRDIAREILRSDQHTLHIDYISSGKTKQREIYVGTRDKWMYYRYRQDTTKCYKFINKDIGYITLKTIRQEDIDKIKKEFINTKGIIIDIRNYPSTSALYSLGSYFVSKNTPFVKCTRGNPDNPGEFNFTSALEIPKSEETYQGKLVVLVNEHTQSQAEFTTMAFQVGDNTTVIGSQTAGADGNVSEIILPGGLKTMISGIGIYYPDGRQTQRIGIVPDIEVKPTIQGIREGRDEVLEKAIEIIDKK